MSVMEQLKLTRRLILGSAVLAFCVATTKRVGAAIIQGTPPWKPFAYNPPEVLNSDGWIFFTAEEAATVEAIVDRIIPADNLSISGKDAGCAVFIDRQLAGSYGTYEKLYMTGPFQDGTPQQGEQTPVAPRERYRLGLAALNAYCQQTAQQPFAKISAQKQDEILSGLEKKSIKLNGVDSELFFLTVLQNTMEGFFSDPIYGGNRNMVSWKMIGFPGARYDYREYVDKHNQKIDLPPLSIAGRPEWKAKA